MENISKEQLRKDLEVHASDQDKSKPGRIAEILRKSDCYQKAGRIYCGPSPLLKQVRINALLDGKELVMPGPGMKEGFYRIMPYAVSFRKLSLAVTYKGLGRYGKKLDNPDLKGLAIDLLIDYADLVDRSGYFLGDGKGFFDLALAILGDTGALSGKYSVVMTIPASGNVVDSLPHDRWDIQANFILSSSGMNSVVEAVGRPGIIWEELAKDRIKRVSPLWKHYVATMENKEKK